MYLLTCSCGATLPIAASQAGNVVACPRCGRELSVPKLGELRQLPTASAAGPATGREPRLPLWRRLVFAALAAVAMGSTAWSLVALFQWQTTEVPLTMAEHIQHDRQQLEQAPPAELARLWAEFEAFDLYEPRPYDYQVAAEARAAWRRSTLVAAAVAIASVVAAILLVITGRRRSSPPPTLGTLG